MGAGDYATAAKDFDTIITTYPSTPNFEDIQIKAGYAFLHTGDYLKTISELAPLLPEKIKPEFRGRALFFTGLAQFSQAHKLTDPKDSADFYRQAEETLTTLVGFINANPTPDNKDLMEDAFYYQALAAYGQNHFDIAEKDMIGLLAKFPTSLQKPDYLLLLGSIYAVEANDDINAKKSNDVVKAAAQKAIDTLDQVSIDPNARIQANEASMRKADIYMMIAPLDAPSIAGYEKAVDAYKQVFRKDDMIAIQQKRVDQLRAAQQKQLQNASAAAAYKNSSLLDRETGRLKTLQEGPDPIIQALINMADCYVFMKKPDEARTVLHRLKVVKLTPQQQQDVDFQFVYSYALGGRPDKADAALTDFQTKYPKDSRADSISVQIASGLMERKDYAGALAQAQRSLKDYAAGSHVDKAVQLESEALTKLGRVDEANKAMDDFITKHPESTVAVQLLVTKGEGQVKQHDLKGALESFGKVKDNPKAGPFQIAADAYYINTLNDLKMYNQVITEATAFETKYPKDPARASVSVIKDIAMDKKHDPGAVAAFQATAKDFADNEEVGSYALYYVISIYQREKKIPEMMQAVAALRTSFPKAYALILQSTDSVVEELKKQKKFEDAVAAYQPLVDVPLKEIGAQAQNKIGDVWLAAAKAMGSYQSLQTDLARAEAEKRLHSAEDAYLNTLKNFSDDVNAVGNAFKGVVDTGLQRRSWGLLKDADLEGYLAKLCAGLTTPDMQTRLELAKAGLVFVMKDGRAQYSAALDRFNKALAASTSLVLTVQEADHYGLLLIAAKNYPKALEVFNALLNGAKPNEQIKLAEAYYGLGATYLAQGDIPNAKANFIKMQTLPNGAAWSDHAMDANLGMAEINEQSSDPADQNAAKLSYATIMSSPTAGALLQAQAMIGYGNILAKSGHAVKAANQQDIEYATHYYEQVDLFYGPATPELSAEALYLAGTTYAKAGDAANAKKNFDKLRTDYAKTAPDWVAKAPAQ